MSRDESRFYATGRKVSSASKSRSPHAELLAVPDDEQFVASVYQTLLKRSPDPEGFDHYLGVLRTRRWSRESIIEAFLKSDEYRCIQAAAGDVDESPPHRHAPTPSNAEYDRQTIAVLERCLRRDSNCVDVGCHTGTILREMLVMAPEGRHFGFEPLPDLHRQVQEMFADAAAVRLFNLALSDVAGASSFQHVVNDPGYSGLRLRRYDRPDPRVVEIRVRTDLLDSIIPRDLLIDLVKIDVEGAELQVMRGGIETLRRSRPVVIFEHGLGGADHYGTRPEDVYDLLAQCGLRISLMDLWLRGESSLSRQEFRVQFDRGLNYYFMAHR